MHRAVLGIAIACLMLGITACHTMRFEVGSGPVSETVYQRKSFFVGGLFPTREVDVSKHCPNGAVAIREETRFVDGLFNVITLGIWTPRSSWYYCAG
jgi:hypothetical protein